MLVFHQHLQSFVLKGFVSYSADSRGKKTCCITMKCSMRSVSSSYSKDSVFAEPSW